MTKQHTSSAQLLSEIEKTMDANEALLDQSNNTLAAFDAMRQWCKGAQTGVQRHLGSLVLQSAADAARPMDINEQLRLIAHAVAVARKEFAQKPRPVRGKKRRRNALLI
jgi:hypothetical protein